MQFRNVEGGEARFHALLNFPVWAVPFGKPQADANLQHLVCQQPMAHSPLWPLPPLYCVLRHRDSRSWRLGCPGTFPIHKMSCYLPGRRRRERSRKGRESPALSKFLLQVPSSVTQVFLSSMGVRLIASSTAFSCIWGTITPDLRSWMLTVELSSLAMVVKTPLFVLPCRQLSLVALALCCLLLCTE